MGARARRGKRGMETRKRQMRLGLPNRQEEMNVVGLIGLKGGRVANEPLYVMLRGNPDGGMNARRDEP